MGKNHANSKMARKALTVLLSVSIFLLGMILCIKPICSSVINHMLIEDEFRSYIMNIVSERYPDLNESQLNTVSKIIDDNPDLEMLISQYFDATAASSQSLEGIEVSATGEVLDHLYSELTLSVESQLKDGMSEVAKQEFIDYLDMNEQQVLEIFYRIPFYLNYFSSYVPAALKLYEILTSKVLIVVVTLIVGISGGGLIYIQKRNWYWLRSFGIAATGNAIILGICVPLILNAVSPVLASRFLGISLEIKLTSLYVMGVINLIAGLIFLIIGYFLAKHVRSTKRDRKIKSGIYKASETCYNNTR